MRKYLYLEIQSSQQYDHFAPAQLPPTIEFKEIALQLTDLDLTYQEAKK